MWSSRRTNDQRSSFAWSVVWLWFDVVTRDAQLPETSEMWSHWTRLVVGISGYVWWLTMWYPWQKQGKRRLLTFQTLVRSSSAIYHWFVWYSAQLSLNSFCGLKKDATEHVSRHNATRRPCTTGKDVESRILAALKAVIVGASFVWARVQRRVYTDLERQNYRRMQMYWFLTHLQQET